MYHTIFCPVSFRILFTLICYLQYTCNVLCAPDLCNIWIEIKRKRFHTNFYIQKIQKHDWLFILEKPINTLLPSTCMLYKKNYFLHKLWSSTSVSETPLILNSFVFIHKLLWQYMVFTWFYMTDNLITLFNYHSGQQILWNNLSRSEWLTLKTSKGLVTVRTVVLRIIMDHSDKTILLHV